jgi:hypothetical protein
MTGEPRNITSSNKSFKRDVDRLTRNRLSAQRYRNVRKCRLATKVRENNELLIENTRLTAENARLTTILMEFVPDEGLTDGEDQFECMSHCKIGANGLDMVDVVDAVDMVDVVDMVDMVNMETTPSVSEAEWTRWLCETVSQLECP